MPKTLRRRLEAQRERFRRMAKGGADVVQAPISRLMLNEARKAIGLPQAMTRWEWEAEAPKRGQQ